LLSAPTFVNAAADTPRFQSVQQEVVACRLCSSIHTAVDNDHPKCIHALISKDHSVLTNVNHYGLDPLSWATATDKTDAAIKLLEYDLWVADCRKRTPLHMAVIKENIKLVQAIITFLQGQDEITCSQILNAQDDTGKTALHYAAEGGCTSIVNTLLESPFINVSLKENDGKTALHYATATGVPAITEALIAHGASIQETDNTGKTIIDQMTYLSQNRNNGTDAAIMATLTTATPNPDLVEFHAQTPAPDVARPTPQRPPAQNELDDNKSGGSEDISEQQETQTPPKAENAATMYAAGAFFLGLVILAFESSEAYNKAADKIIAEKQKLIDENSKKEEKTEADDLDEDPSYSLAEVLSYMWQSFKQKSWSKKKTWITGATLTLGGLGTWTTLKIKE
jgi:ankyrin repeat protein